MLIISGSKMALRGLPNPRFWPGSGDPSRAKLNLLIMAERGYPGHLEEGFEPYDPLELIRQTEALVSRGTSRKYTSFYCAGVYGGISTGYTVGCCLRCAFCWVDWSRDAPERFGRFCTPDEVFQRLVAKARKKRVAKLRVSGGEPTLAKAHLLGLLDLVETTDYLFILETNGIPLAAEESYAWELARYNRIHVRVSLKAGSAQGFEARTGARGKFWELPFLAIQRLMEAGVSFHVAAMSDPRLMPPAERREMIRSLAELGYEDYLEEERCDPYPTSVARLRAAGFHIFEEGT
jgi:uncharacterized Fe-S cluster-containing radical SAM superfamily protein